MPLMAKGIGPGDAIFTTPFTFVATAEVISLVGATPVFVDIDPKTFNIDPVKLEKAIERFAKGERPTPKYPAGLKARGIIGVDIFGLPAAYDEINRIAARHELTVIEDAAQSFGGIYKGRKACGLAEIGATSFFPAKPLGCYGDGGAVFTNDDGLAEVMKSVRVHGQGEDKYENVRVGINGRMDTLQAAILLAKLEVFENEILNRQEVARRYAEELKGIVQTPFVSQDYRSAWAQYSVLSDNREQLLGKLKKAGIPTAIYYPKPLHLQTAFANLGYKEGDMPVSEKISKEILSLPMHGYLKSEEQKRIAEAIAR
jgi:dTDP-4-amino-4,6-dideoxygalactose transaminase